MSRTGVEEKLPWRQVPPSVRAEVARVMGAPVVRGMRIWGGYSAAPTFRLVLADGQRAFFKAINADSTEFSVDALNTERRVYAELSELLGAWMPACYASVAVDGWQILLLEDLGPKSVPPWSPRTTRQAAHGMAAFHLSTLEQPLPAWLSRPRTRLAHERWADVVEQSQNFVRIAAWSGTHASQALTWLEHASPRIAEQMTNPVLYAAPHALLHGDLRSDNLRLHRGKLTLFDWPAITVGRAEWDMVAFAQAVTVEGGVAPEQVMAWYAERFPVDDAVVDSALAWWFAFFALRAWQDELPGLPRLRRFQRQQLGVLAQWLARRWALPPATWAEGLTIGQS